MAFDDLELDRPTSGTPPDPETEPERGSLLRWLAVGLFVLSLAGMLLIFGQHATSHLNLNF